MNSQKRRSGKSKGKIKMKLKTVFLMLLITIFISYDITMVNAATISDDGKYTLVLHVTGMDDNIDGEYCKIIKFDVADGETTVSLSELTKGIIPFNGEYEFSHWGKDSFDDTKADDFTSSGDFYMSDGTVVDYTNGLSLYAKFSDKPLKGTGTYYLTFDPFAGTINGKTILRLTSKSTEFQTVDLTKYTPVRKGCTFRGWDLNGNLVTSIDASDFANSDAVNVTATYTQDTFSGDEMVLILNANGGTIDGKASNKYDYLGGANSGTSMSLLPYTPVREGYTFTGWNSKSDGSGKNYNYLYWRLWDKDGATELEKDTLIENSMGYQRYQNLTLYATWIKNADTPTQPAQETVKEIESTGEIEGNIEFADGINKNYRLDIEEVELKKELVDKNVKFLVDINVLDGDTIVKISDTKMKIRIALPEDLKGYSKYEAVYILNDEIKETIPATVEDGYIVFEASHLSQYGIVATNTDLAIEDSGKKITSPKTGDNNNIAIWFGTLFLSCLMGCIVYGRYKKLNKRS